MTSAYNNPNVPQGQPLDGFSAAQPQDSPQVQQAKAIFQQQYPDLYQRYAPQVDNALSAIENTYFQNPIENVGTVAALVTGANIHTEAPRYMQQVNRQAVNTEGLPPNYADSLRALNVSEATLNEFLSRTLVKEQGLSLDEARQRWFESAKRNDITSFDGKELSAPIADVDTGLGRKQPPQDAAKLENAIKAAAAALSGQR